MPNSSPGSQTMPSPAGGGAPSTEASQHSTGNGGNSGSFEEPWADIGDNSGDDYENTGAADTDIGSADNAGFEQEPDFSDTEPASGNGQTDVFSEYEQTPGTDGTYPGAATTSTGPVLTDGEQVAILDEQLDGGTDKFDDMILKEREAIRRTASRSPRQSEQEIEPDTGEDHPGSIYNAGNSDTASESLPDPGEQTKTDTGEDYPGSVYNAGNSSADPSAGPANNQKSGTENARDAVAYPVPDGIPDGSDDDITAKIIRDLAENELDRERADKLWGEYCKYTKECPE